MLMYVLMCPYLNFGGKIEISFWCQMQFACGSNFRVPTAENNVKACKALSELQAFQVPERKMSVEMPIVARIREIFKKPELFASPYDTAWVAMVPCNWDNSHDGQHKPCFDQCLKWVIENQKPDGSWGLNPIPSHPFLLKDSLSSTLASVLALQKWKVGEQLVQRGLDYIGSNISAMSCEHQISPFGFDIIFPGMIESAQAMCLNLHLDETLIKELLNKRIIQIESLKGNEVHLAYVAEGLGESHNWKDVMKYQRVNGSLFNSPSTTAAALNHHPNIRCFEYLQSLLRCQAIVPAVYPMDVYTRLSMISTLERLGIDGYFSNDISSILDDTYRCWIQGSEEIFEDILCCAIGFRILRMNGYEVSADALEKFDDQSRLPFLMNSPPAEMTNTILELYRASQVRLFRHEPVLDKIHAWTNSILKQALSNGMILDSKLHNEVSYALKHPQSNLERIENRRCIEHYDIHTFNLHKTSYRFLTVMDRSNLLEFAVHDFNSCQTMYREELKLLERWIKDYRIDSLNFARQKVVYAYFSIAAVLSHPDHSEARISWAKNTVLVTLIDDFFDYGGSMEELRSVIHLLENWENSSSIGYSSKEVEIMFYAIHNSIKDFSDKALPLHGWNIENHLVEIYLRLCKAMMREAKWAKEKIVPTLDEYTQDQYFSIALEPVILISAYFLGPKLSEKVVRSEEYKTLYKRVGTIVRMLNDVTSNERECAEGKLNGLALRLFHGGGGVTEDDAKREMKELIERERRKLLEMVLQTQGSVVPKVCKDLFWKGSKICHLFYLEEDGFTSQTKMVSGVNSIIHQPIVLPTNLQLD